MKRLFFLGLAIILAAPANSPADGCFVAPKFVWNKHKDINEPTQKAILIYDGGREDLILQVKYEGPVDEFGWLIPVPNLPTVQLGAMKCFYELSQYTQRLWEPPVSGSSEVMTSGNSAGAGGPPEPPVKVIEIKTVGAYEFAVLSTKDSAALGTWLEANQFYFPTNKTDVLNGYIKQQWFFVAVRINSSKNSVFEVHTTPRQAQKEQLANDSTQLKLASGELNPLQISFDSDRCVFIALRVPRGLAVVVVVLLAFGGIFALGGVMARQVTQLADELPHYQETISAKIKSLRGAQSGGTLQHAEQVLEDLEKELNRQQQQQPAGQAAAPELAPGRGAPIAVEVHEPTWRSATDLELFHQPPCSARSPPRASSSSLSFSF